MVSGLLLSLCCPMRRPIFVANANRDLEMLLSLALLASFDAVRGHIDKSLPQSIYEL